MAQQPFEQALKDEGLVGTPLESLARSIYMQESGAGRNTKTSNAGAVGGMQILPGTFKEVMPEGNINDPYDNARAGLRYIKKMYDTSGGDLNLTAVGYYGGPGGIQKAKQGVAVRDPRNPNAPDTLEYAKQVMARTDVSRGTPPKIIRKNIENLGTGYQAAFALMSAADEEPENEREKAAREAQEETESAQQFAAIQKQLTGTKLTSPFEQEPVKMFGGGLLRRAMASASAQAKKEPTEGMTEEQRREYNYNNPYPTVSTPIGGRGIIGRAIADAIGKVAQQQARQVRPEFIAEFARRFQVAPQQPVTPQQVMVQTPMFTGPSVQPTNLMSNTFQTPAYGAMPNPVPQPQAFMAQGGPVEGYQGGGMPFQPTVPEGLNQSVVMMNNGGQVSIEKRIADKIGLGPAYDASVQAPKDLGMSGDEGTQGDAVRHMVLMREIDKKYGPTAARVLGYGHEFGMGMFRGQSSRDREMDLDNNALGLQLSKQAGSDDDKFRELMRQSLSDKRATYYRDEYKKPVRRAEGSPEEGESTGKAFQEDGPQTAKKMLKDIGRGVSYYPYDLAGAPVDVMNMGLKAVDYLFNTKLSTEKPVGGSEYLIEKSRNLGIAEKPTGSAAEELARFGSAFVNPASGARATGRVLTKAGEVAQKGAETAGLAATRAITKNPDISAKQMYDALLGQQMPATAAVRPKGGVYLGAQSMKDAPLSPIDEDILEVIGNIDRTNPQGKAIAEFIDKKVRKYHQVDQGTPNDPIFKGIIEGRIESRRFPPEKVEAARRGDTTAYNQLRELYDNNLGMKTIVPEVSAAKPTGFYFETLDKIKQEMKDKIEQQRPGEPFNLLGQTTTVDQDSIKRWPELYDFPGVKALVKEAESNPVMNLLNPSILPPHLRVAAKQAEPVAFSWYGDRNPNLLPELADITDYLSTRTPAEIKNMGYADVVAKTQEWHAMLEQARKDPSKFSKKQLTQGTELFMPASNDMKWLDVKSSDALSLEGNIMGHCVGGSNYCSAVDEGTKKIVSLRDKKGIPHVTIELASDNKNGVFDRVVQVKGTGNSQPIKYFPQIDEFLTEYQSKLGDTKLRITEADTFLPEAWREFKTTAPSFRRVDDRGAWVRYQNADGEMIEEYVLRGDPRFPDMDLPDLD